MLNISSIRNDFPMLSIRVHGKPLVYLDNGATTQKPRVVIETIRDFYASRNSTIHRGVHNLSELATEAYEGAREEIRDFINAGNTNEIVFTSGATASINLAAFSFGEKYIRAGDEVVISEMEHHSNLVPWQLMCRRKGAKLKIIPINEKGELIMEVFGDLISEKTRLIAVTHISNSLGTVNPIGEIINTAHLHDIPVLIDAAQSVQHLPTDVRALNCDFLVFSGHKIYGPTGTGVLYAKEKYLAEMPPYQSGGDMVDCVTLEKTTFNELPLKFEAGTTNYVGIIAMAEAIRYIRKTGIDDIMSHENDLLEYGTEKLNRIEDLRIYGESDKKIGIFSFLINGIHPYDAGMVMDKMGLALRTGAHCTQPVMDHFGIAGTLRASLAMYNTREEIDVLYEALEKVRKMFL